MDFSNRILYISSEELFQWRSEHKRFSLLDTLPNDHFEAYHLPEAMNACVYQVDFIDQVHSIIPDTGGVIVVYDSSSKSMGAKTAAEKLLRAGYSQVFVLTGGIEAWREGGYPLEGEGRYPVDDPQTFFRATDKIYTLMPEESTIQWFGRNPQTTHHGTVDLAGGSLVLSQDNLSGWFEIDMNTIYNVNLEGDELHPVLIAHLKSDDFFDVQTHPKARFTINMAEKAAEPFLTTPNYKIFGELELCGKSGKLGFPVNFYWGEANSLIMNANFNLDRTLWGVIYGSSRYYEHLGMHKVFDFITIQFKLVGYPADEVPDV